ncbi:hypothetical protein [Mangrovicoccus ximenensis]|uniref:hypothetical protein n=1 Tax=Mangrovicoccus ximenensis TaxID=1911570 RepID=UPI0011AE78ED|nr:hypothetical protein [Mangrovicoccus ximenensis]
MASFRMPGADARAHELIGDIYGIALEPDAIPRLLALLVRATGNASAIFCHRELGGGCVEITHGIDPVFDMPMQHHAERNPLVARTAQLRIGAPIPGDGLLEAGEVRRSGLYNEVWKPAGLDHVIGVNLARQAGLVSSVWIARPASLGAHSRDEFGTASMLAGHLCRAMALRRKLIEGEARAALLREGLDALSLPVAITAPDGRLAFANAAGEAALRTGPHLLLSRGRGNASPVSGDARRSSAMEERRTASGNERGPREATAGREIARHAAGGSVHPVPEPSPAAAAPRPGHGAPTHFCPQLTCLPRPSARNGGAERGPFGTDRRAG